MPVPPRFFWGHCEFKGTTKNVLQKNRAEKFLQKDRQKSKTDFLSIFVYHVFGRLSVRRVQKQQKNTEKNKSDPGVFMTSDPPTHHGGDRIFFLGGPVAGTSHLPGGLKMTRNKQQNRPANRLPTSKLETSNNQPAPPHLFSVFRRPLELLNRRAPRTSVIPDPPTCRLPPPP
jgi:hypothetical protein